MAPPIRAEFAPPTKHLTACRNDPKPLFRDVANHARFPSTSAECRE